MTAEKFVAVPEQRIGQFAEAPDDFNPSERANGPSAVRLRDRSNHTVWQL